MKYVVLPKVKSGWGDDEAPMLEGRTVYEDDPTPTGLLDKDGNPIYRMRSPIGFGGGGSRG